MRRYRRGDHSRLLNSSIQESTGAAFSFEGKMKPVIGESKLGKREKGEKQQLASPSKSESSTEIIFKEDKKNDDAAKRQKISIDFDVQELFDTKKLQESMSDKMSDAMEAKLQTSIKKIEKQLADKIGK